MTGRRLWYSLFCILTDEDNKFGVSILQGVGQRSSLLSAPLCRMVGVVLLKFSFVFTDQEQDSWRVHHTDLRFQSEGKKLAFKK